MFRKTSITRSRIHPLPIVALAIALVGSMVALPAAADPDPGERRVLQQQEIRKQVRERQRTERHEAQRDDRRDQRRDRRADRREDRRDDRWDRRVDRRQDRYDRRDDWRDERRDHRQDRYDYRDRYDDRDRHDRRDRYESRHRWDDRYGDHWRYRHQPRYFHGRPWYGTNFHNGLYIRYGHYRGERFDVPRHLRGHHYRDYHYGRFFHAPRGVWLDVYLFPVYYYDRVEYRPYAYCEDEFFGRAHFDPYGGLSFDFGFRF